jgi:hypothetical protein
LRPGWPHSPNLLSFAISRIFQPSHCHPTSMSHPYSGAASYIYASNYLASSAEDAYGSGSSYSQSWSPYTPMPYYTPVDPRAMLLHQRRPWPSQDRPSMETSMPSVSVWGSERGLTGNPPARCWRTKRAGRPPRRKFQPEIRLCKTLNNVHLVLPPCINRCRLPFPAAPPSSQACFF